MGSRSVQSIRVEHIHVGERHRKAPEDAVERLARSISEIGLRTPITVRVVDEMELDGEMVEGVPVLVTGATRLAAAGSLEWSHIDCFVDDCDEIDAELWEIDENLCRAELSEAEEAQHLARRKELWVQRKERENRVEQVVPAEVGYKKPPPSDKGFAAETAALTGETKQSINRKISRGEQIAPDVLKSITGTRWDKGVNLDILKKLSHAEQRQAFFRVKTIPGETFEDAYEFIHGGPPTAPKIAKPAVPLNDFETVDKQVSALMSAWNRAGKEAREDFLSRIERPVMDGRFA